MTRRDVLRLAVAGAALVLAPRTSRAAEGRIDILIDEPIGSISPDLHGHFVEHLGGVVYDGIWVGEGSPVPNIGGIRTALVDALRRLEPGPIRYPGGCFADSYDWRDGTGPRASRPRRLNFWAGASEWGGAAPGGPETYDPNHFGTNEFLRFCEPLGLEPIVRVQFHGRLDPELGLALRVLDMHVGAGFLARKEVKPKPLLREYRSTHERSLSPRRCPRR